jgi:hypothetical protein
LDKVLAEIDATFGKGSVMRLGEHTGFKARAADAKTRSFSRIFARALTWQLRALRRWTRSAAVC